MKPVRKAAGAVRDMDVLVADALTLPKAAKNESIVRLVEHLGSLRDKNSGKLREIIAVQRKEARRHLKQCVRLVRSGFSNKKLQNMQALACGSRWCSHQARHQPSLVAAAEPRQHS